MLPVLDHPRFGTLGLPFACNLLTVGHTMVLGRSCAECGMRLVRRSWRSGSSRASSSASSSGSPSDDLRDLMRHVAQPVAVVSVALPQSTNQNPVFHGATISSFTSIALHPKPLVAFSLRLPSRMAEALQEIRQDPNRTNRVSIALLSTELQPTARAFSRPHESHAHLYGDQAVWERSQQDGLPRAKLALGNLICEVAHSIDLSALEHGEEGAGSEMFICRVIRVEAGLEGEPLLYLRHKFVKPGEEIEEKESIR